MKIKTLLKRFLLLMLILIPSLIQSSCKKDVSQVEDFPDPSTLPQGLKGSWLETISRIDTLVFTENKTEGLLWLKNGKNFKIFFPYKITPDSIFISDPVSSSLELSNGKNYYFNFDEPKLTINIEHFTFKLSVNNINLIFRKIQ